jgi:polysaccharide pyruvyl transferase WcaK-like protein
MKKILYSGFYGFKNTGDDAFLEVAAWGSKVFLNTENIVFLAHGLPKLVNDFQELGKPLFKGFDRIQGLREMVNADYFISAGGSTFVDHKKHYLKALAEIAKKTVNRKIQTGAIGVSIGPFKNSEYEQNVIKYLKQLNFLTLRDNRSYEYVNTLDLPYKPIEAFDLAALLPLVYAGINKLPKNKNKKIIGVSVCPYESISKLDEIKNENRRNESIIKLLKKINKNNEDVTFRFFVINGHKVFGDKKLTLDVINKSQIKNFELVDYQNSVLSAWNLIGQCDVMIATRLHAAILAAYNDVPFILNEYHQKCTDFLTDVGQHEDWVVGDAEYEDDKIINVLSRVINKESKIEKPLFISDTQKKSLKNFSF